MNRIDLTGKNAVVTGGARGIGYAIARRILESGAACCIWDVNEEARPRPRTDSGKGEHAASGRST